MLQYLSVADGRRLDGLRLVLTPGVPGPWSVAAKAILELKSIDFVPVAQRMGERDADLFAWTGQESAPAAMYRNERPRTQWDEILLFAERLAPEPRLIPRDEAARAAMFGIGHAICGEDGFGWNCRSYMLYAQGRAAERGESDANVLASDQLATLRARYFDPVADAEREITRISSVLEMLAARLRDGRKFLVADELSAADLYWASFSNLVKPMAHEVCPMPDAYRVLGNIFGSRLDAALCPELITHRDRISSQYFQLPMRF